jgi:S-(hydroxymethyl)glutathione dehydrogenase/alcohol dehydrogenase
MSCIGTFEPYTVVNEASCIKIDPSIPLDKAALVGCGVTTGWGSAVYAADVRAGETVVVIGCGGIGMNAIQGARLAGAQHIVAVDPVESKRDRAGIFGATHTAASFEEAQALVGELTWGVNADKAILTTGVAEGHLIDPMMALVKKAGRAVVTAVAPRNQSEVSLNLLQLAMLRKELVGCIFGNANPRRDIPRLLKFYMDGKLKLDELVTTRYALEDINQGYQDMRDGVKWRRHPVLTCASARRRGDGRIPPRARIPTRRPGPRRGRRDGQPSTVTSGAGRCARRPRGRVRPCTWCGRR